MPEVMSIEVDDEFDPRPPKQPFSFRDEEGNWNWPMIAGIALAIVLVITLFVVVTKPFTPAKVVEVSKWTPKDPTKDVAFLESYASTSSMVSSVQRSLDSWAKFNTTGDLEDVGTSFDLAGNQYALLSAQQPEIFANPEPGQPSIVELGPVGKVERKNDIFTVRVVVSWTKPGSTDGKSYNWDIDMKSKDNRFILNTVRETDPDDKPPVDFCGAAGVISDLEPDDEIGKQIGKFEDPAKQLELANATYKIRVKSWEFLEAATAGSDSEADVYAIVNNYRGIVEVGIKAESLKDLDQADNSDVLENPRNAISERIQGECGDIDISGR